MFIYSGHFCHETSLSHIITVTQPDGFVTRRCECDMCEWGVFLRRWNQSLSDSVSRRRRSSARVTSIFCCIQATSNCHCHMSLTTTYSVSLDIMASSLHGATLSGCRDVTRSRAVCRTLSVYPGCPGGGWKSTLQQHTCHLQWLSPRTVHFSLRRCGNVTHWGHNDRLPVDRGSGSPRIDCIYPASINSTVGCVLNVEEESNKPSVLVLTSAATVEGCHVPPALPSLIRPPSPSWLEVT